MYKLHRIKDIDIIGVQIDFGASQKGVAMGPLAIRYAGVREDLRRMGYTVRDKGDIIPPPDGMSLRYVHVYAVDAKGNRVPTAADEVTLDVQGAATIQAIDDGNHYTDELMNVNPKHLYKGQLLLILRSTQQPGTVTVKASSPALKAANYKFSSQ